MLGKCKLGLPVISSGQGQICHAPPSQFYIGKYTLRLVMISELFRFIIAFIIDVSHCKEVRYPCQITFIPHLFVNQILDRRTDIGIQREVPYSLINVYHHIGIRIAVRTILIGIETIGTGKGSQSRCITFLSHANIGIIHLDTSGYIEPIRELIS